MIPQRAIWADKRVLITGHSGFKGYWLAVWLQELGADVFGLSLKGVPQVGLRDLAGSISPEFFADIRGHTWEDIVRDFNPNVIFHLAAQSLVLSGYKDPLGTFETNVGGTAKLLASAARLTELEVVLVATTDKVYSPNAPQPYTEDSPLGGQDPYSASKACTELVVHSWPDFAGRCVTARAGNVIGGGDFAEYRLLPDLVRSWTGSGTPTIRNPHATRPWQHVLEPLRGYLLFAEALMSSTAELPPALNFGPSMDQVVTVNELVEVAADTWKGLSQGAVHFDHVVHDAAAPKESPTLALDSNLAKQTIGWSNVLTWDYALRMTIDWYFRHWRGEFPQNLIREQLAEYSVAASKPSD